MTPSAPSLVWQGSPKRWTGAAARLPPGAGSHGSSAVLPGFLPWFVQPGRRVSWAAGAGMCAGPEPARLLVTRCLPPGLWEPGDTPVGCREWRLVGLEQAPAWGGAVALHVRRAGASPPLPSPTAPHSIVPSRSPELPQGPASRPLHTRGPRVPCAGLHRGRWPQVPRRQAALGRAKPDLGAGSHGPGADRYFPGETGAKARPRRSCRAWWVPDTGAQRGLGCGQRREGSYPAPPGRNLLGQVGAGRWRSWRQAPWAESLPRGPHQRPGEDAVV